MRYVILGGGAAGLSAAEKIKELDPGSEVILAEKEKALYSKKFIPGYIFSTTQTSKMYTKSLNQLKRIGITLLTEHEAIQIDPKEKNVYFKDQEKVMFDKLLIATGYRSSNLNFDISESKGLTDLDYLHQIEQLKETIVPLEKAAIIGNDLRSIQITLALSKAGLSTMLFVQEPFLLNDILNKEQSDALIAHMTNEHLKIITSAIIQKIEKNTVYLSNKKEFSFDHIIHIGDYIECHKDIEMISDLDSNDIFIYESRDNNHEISVENGINLAQSMVNNEIKDIIYSTHELGDNIIDLAYWGEFNIDEDEDENSVIIVRQKDAYKKIIHIDGKLVGFVFIGDTKKTGKLFEIATNETLLTKNDFKELLS